LAREARRQFRSKKVRISSNKRTERDWGWRRWPRADLTGKIRAGKENKKKKKREKF
jgi:hypothetical protein